MSLTPPTEKTQYSGGMLRLKSRRPLHSEIARSGLAVGVERIGNSSWQHVTYQAESGVSAAPGIEPFPSQYSFLVREAEERFTIVAKDDLFVERFMTHLGVQNTLERPHVNVPRIVDDLVVGDRHADGERHYLMRAVWAAVEGFGPSLRTMSFFGENLADARLFTQSLPSLSPFRVGVRELRHENEVLSIGANGELNFYFRGPDHLIAIDRLFFFFKEGNFITWP